MTARTKRILNRRTATAIVMLALFGCPTASIAHNASPFMNIGTPTPPPSGWIEFCDTYKKVCDTKPSKPRVVAFSKQAWNVLNRVNLWVNEHVTPTTDMAHYGQIEWWRYPDDGAGACHSYALLKRWLLMQAGWPREALLMTVVLDREGEGHAVLTVKTDKGDFILDNLRSDVRLWSHTGYKYLMRQSASDPNMWFSVATSGSSINTAMIGRRSNSSDEPNGLLTQEQAQSMVTVRPLPVEWLFSVAAKTGLELTDAAIAQSDSIPAPTPIEITADVAAKDPPQEMSSADVRSAQVHSAEVGLADIDSTFVHAAKVALAELYSAELSSTELQAEVHLAAVASTEVRSAKVDLTELRAAKVDLAKFQSAEIHSAAVDSTEGHSAEAQTGWIVQLFGNASEAVVLNSYRRLQKAYATLLGSRQPLIIRSHVGTNASWYRVRVATVSRQDADRLCDGLRAAGGACLVQRS